MKPPTKIRLHVALSPGAASRLRALAAAEGTDLSGMVEFLVRSRKRAAGRAAPAPPVAPGLDGFFLPTMRGRVVAALPVRPPVEEEPEPDLERAPAYVYPPNAAELVLRDPTSEEAPETIRHLARLVQLKDVGIAGPGKAALKAWMLGDDDALRLLGTPVDVEVPEAVAEAPEPKKPTPAPEVPPAPVAPPEAPPKPLRDYSAPDAPAWVRRIVGALADGLDALVPEEAMESLRAWRRGEDVEEPNLSSLTDEE